MERRRRSIFDLLEEYFERLEELMGRYIERAEERRLWHPSSETIEPLSNVYVEPLEVVVTVDIPCADRDRVDVRFVDENTVEVEAQLQRRIDFESLRVTHMRGEFRRYYTRISLPVPVDPSRASITCYRNVLEIRAPRKPGY